MTPEQYARGQYERARENLVDTAILYVRGADPPVLLKDLRSAVERVEKADRELEIVRKATEGAAQHGA